MDVYIEKRAEVALRTLSSSDQRKVEKTLQHLSSIVPKQLTLSNDIRALRVASGQMVYIARVGRALRMVFSIKGNDCFVQDIVHRDRIERIVSLGN